MRRWPLFALLATGCLEAPPTGSEVCGTLGALHDELDDGDARWVRYDSTIASGRMELYATNSSTSAAVTAWKYQLDGEVTLQLRALDLMEGELRFVLVNADGDSIGLFAAGDRMRVETYVADQLTSPASDRFDPSMLWWRMRATGGQLEWMTSSDGSHWNEHPPVEDPLTGPVAVEVELFTEGIQANVDVEALNPGGFEEACPAGSLVDPFDAESARWEPGSADACSVHSNGQLLIEYDQMEDCGLYSAERFDLRGSSFAAEVVDVGDCDPSFTMVVDLLTQQAEISCENDAGTAYLAAGLYGGPDSPDTLAFVTLDPEAHRFWRIASDPAGELLTFETADPAGQWTPLASEPVAPELLTQAAVALLVTDPTPEGEIEQVVIESFNLEPR